MVVELVESILDRVKDQMVVLQQSHLVEQLTQPQVVVVAEVVVCQVEALGVLVVVFLVVQLLELEILLQ
tara:strand:+ start:261 stop:467 length:207 start_codon:yes stop_codon:yes gene_type:complete